MLGRSPGFVGVVAVVLGWFTAMAALGEGERPLFLPFDATMEGVPLEPGTYLANIVAHGKTSRLLFTVGEPKIKVEFSKVLDFLKKKAGVE